MISRIKNLSPTLVQTGFVTMSKIAMAVAAMFLQVLLARILGPEGRGSYAVIMIFSSGVASFIILGTDRAIQQQVVSGGMKNGEAISLTWILIFVLSLLGSIVAMLFLFYGNNLVDGFFRKASIEDFAISLILIVPLLYGISLNLLFYANGNFLSSNIYLVGEPVLRFVMIFSLLIFHKISLFNIILVSFVSGIAINFIGSVYFLRQNVQGGIHLPGIDKIYEVLSYGIRYLPARFGNFFRIHATIIVLASMTNNYEVGIYAVAIGLAGSCLYIPDAINAVLQTKILADTSVYREMTAKYMRLIGGSTSIVILLMVAGLVVITPVLFGSDFSYATTMLLFLTPGIIFSTLSSPLTAYFVCTNKPGIVSFSIAIEIFVSIAAMLVLYPYFGLIGASIAASTGKLVQFLIQLFKFNFVCGLGLRNIIVPGRSDIKAVIDMVHIFGKANSSS